MSEVSELLEILEASDKDVPVPIEKMSKRGNGFPSEAHVTITSGATKHGEPFQEKLGANDPCPCGSGIKFRSCHMKAKGGWKRGDDYSRQGVDA